MATTSNTTSSAPLTTFSVNGKTYRLQTLSTTISLSYTPYYYELTTINTPPCFGVYHLLISVSAPVIIYIGFQNSSMYTYINNDAPIPPYTLRQFDFPSYPNTSIPIYLYILTSNWAYSLSPYTDTVDVSAVLIFESNDICPQLG